LSLPTDRGAPHLTTFPTGGPFQQVDLSKFLGFFFVGKKNNSFLPPPKKVAFAAVRSLALAPLAGGVCGVGRNPARKQQQPPGMVKKTPYE